MPVLSGLDLSGLPVFLQFSLFLPFRSFASALSPRSLTMEVSLWLFSCRGSGPESGMVNY